MEKFIHKFSYVSCIIIYIVQLLLELNILFAPLILKFLYKVPNKECIEYLVLSILLHILCSLELISLNKRGDSILREMNTELKSKILNKISVIILSSFELYQMVQWAIEIFIFILLVLVYVVGYKSFYNLIFISLIFIYLAISVKKIFLRE